MKKNITITLIACLVLAIVLGSIYAMSLVHPNHPAKDEKKEVVINQNKSQNNMYQAILKEYQDAIENDFYGYLETNDQAILDEHMPHINVNMIKANDELHLVYLYYDIDGDGVDECIIADYNEETYNDGIRSRFAPYNIYDIYQLVDGKVSRYPDLEYCGLNSLFWIGNNHMLINYQFDMPDDFRGPGHLLFFMYKINDEKNKLEIKDLYRTENDWEFGGKIYIHLYGDIKYKITEEELYEGVDSYVLKEKLDWKTLADFE